MNRRIIDFIRRPGARFFEPAEGGSTSWTFSQAESAAMLPNTAIGVSVSGLTLADGDTTVDSWEALYGGISTTLSAPNPTNRPAYSAAGGTGGRPIVQFDGLDNVLRVIAFTKGSAFDDYEYGVVARQTADGDTGDRVIVYSKGLTSRFQINEKTIGWRVSVAGGANVEPATDPSLAIIHFSGDAHTDGTINCRVGGTVVATASSTVTSRPDGETLSIGALPGGSVAGAFEVQAWYCGPALTEDQRTYLRALLTHYTGVDC